MFNKQTKMFVSLITDVLALGLKREPTFHHLQKKIKKLLFINSHSGEIQFIVLFMYFNVFYFVYLPAEFVSPVKNSGTVII